MLLKPLFVLGKMKTDTLYRTCIVQIRVSVYLEKANNLDI